MAETISVYMTAGSEAEAHRVASALIEARLAACVNVLGAVQSVFYWDGVEREDEVALIAKACRADFEALRQKVRAVHSYDCPCIVAWPIVEGDAEFTDWIEQETRGQRDAEGAG